MTEQPGFVPPEEAQAAAAAQLAGQAEIAGDADTVAAQTMDQIRAQVTREVLLPMEQKFDALIAAAKAQSDAMAAQIKALQGQVAAAQASVGPPEVLKYAQAVADRVGAAAAQEGPSRREGWAGVLATVDQILAAAKDAVTTGLPGDIGKLIADVEAFVARGHARAGFGGHSEHFAALGGELESLAEAAAKLVPVVADAVA